MIAIGVLLCLAFEAQEMKLNGGVQPQDFSHER